ncbi:MAG TPA: MFS transporter [Oscillatoriaceae cyanobacterium M33_DOE_052]|uniref:MFS transporter n=1 Tax=Planktothricoides sp. SpSt-374 TaxID=2282167 RepID=A0A7C3ZKR7_9CYAN|nr:MFS transporter [Oscillatoriaceae cyanobacterium M33_DOE_052]
MIDQQSKTRNPWSFIPTLYFAQGLPNIIINSVSVIIYKNLGIPNELITSGTSFLYLPWVLKMLWSPFVDVTSTKRNWIIAMNLGMVCCMVVAAFSLHLPNFFLISLIIFSAAAFVSATYDIAADGFYMLALTPEDQALFAGIRSVFFRLSVIFASGGLVFLAGYMTEAIGIDKTVAWSLTLGIAAVLFAIFLVYHKVVLPFPSTDGSSAATAEAEKTPFAEIIAAYFRQQKITAILAFILLYRFGEAMLVKVAQLFLLDPAEKGGLGLSTQDVGLVYGTFGVISLILGGITGGAIIAKYGLKKTIWPMAWALNLPDLFYVYMAYAQPPLKFVYPLVSLEQFGYGLGFTAFMVYLMYISKGQYKTSHYAISTGIMALGLMVPGAVSGAIQTQVGYPLFFVIVCFLTIPGMLTILFLPLDEEGQS